MLTMEARIKNQDRLEKKYSEASKKLTKGIQRKLKLVGIKVQKESRKNAKISPVGSTDRGGLEKSILWRVQGSKVYIFVPDNGLAGKYAWIQHEHDGRGTGTIRKGARADKEFIDRAVDDNEPWIKKTIGGSFKILERDA